MRIIKINKWFEQRGKEIVTYRWVVLGVLTIIFILGLMGLPKMNLSTSWNDYFLEDDPILVKTEEFKEIFGNDYFVAVLTRCEDTFTKENLELIRELSNELMDSISYADKITSISDIEFMTGDEDGLHIEQIVPEIIPSDKNSLEAIRKKAFSKKHIANRLISSDSRNSWILLKLRTFPPESEWKTKIGAVSPDMITGKEAHHIVTKEKYKALNPLATGMPYLVYRKMSWIKNEFVKTMWIAMAFAILILSLLTRSFKGVIAPITAAIFSIITVYGLLGHINYVIDAGMINIPILLILAIAVAYNIHTFSFFKRRFEQHGKRKQAVVETITEVGWPVFFSALTTFVAVLSFLVIPVTPLHFIGIASASGIMLTFFVVITLTPIFLSFGKNKTKENGYEYHGSKLDRIHERLGAHILKHGKIILSIFSILILIFLFGASKIETAFDIETTMGRKVQYVDEILTVSYNELGSLYSYDILIEFPEEGMAKRTKNLKKLEVFTQEVETYPLTKRSTSILNVIKDINQTLNEGKQDFYTIPQDDNEVAQLLLLYENAGGTESEYWMDYEYKRLRLMVEISSFNSGEAEREMEDIIRYSKDIFPDAKVTTVGNLPQFTTMQQYVARSQISSLGIALILIGILLVIVFGSFKIGLVGLIPNMAPALTVGGLMGWFGISLDMMTATIMPMILGLAVDDTIHFINRAHLEFDRCRNYDLAIRRTFWTVGSPTILTSLIISANFAIYLTSEAIGIRYTGLLAIIGMIAALLGDLFVTPILVKKFNLFGKEKTSNKNLLY